MSVKLANAYTYSYSTTPVQFKSFTVTCSEPKKLNDTATEWAILLKNWFIDNWFANLVFIALVCFIYLYFTKKPDPPQVDDKPKDDCSLDSLMIVTLE